MHCILVIPGILTRDSILIDKLGSFKSPALQRLIAKGRQDSCSWRGIDAWLLESFQVDRQNDWPSAPFALLGDGESPGEDCWVHADPVSLRADRDRLLLMDSARLHIQADEARAIGETFTAHFGEELELRVAAPDRWYARLAAPPEGETAPLASVAGGQVEPGQGAMGWHSLMNEMQMLLHEHPVNEARETRGEAPINGVWLWGAGRLAEVNTGFQSLAAARPLARGLARHAGIAWLAPTDNAAQWLAGLSAEGVHVCVHDELQKAVMHGDCAQWLDALTRLERDWIACLHDALESGRIDMLTLKLGGASRLVSFEAIRRDLRRFWRRPKSLARTLALKGDDENEAA
ncbi:MAG: hypothetical protein EXR28_09770 [Betaproteobacteria bacterium]|nr:hypothetical protein [Betaproteobacteria bacterium]